MKKFVSVVVLVAAGMFMPHHLKAQAKQDTTKSKKESKEKKTDYEKLFAKKKVKTVKGMITLHKMDGKVYFEFPQKLLGKYMLVGSVVESTSHSNDAAAGEQPNPPLPIYFTMEDSTVQMRKASFAKMESGKDKNFAQAFKRSTIGPVLAAFPIKAVSPDSSAYVFNATKFFVNGNKAIDPFGPYGGNGVAAVSNTSFKKGRSTLADVMAYSDNITVSSYLSFNVSTQFLGFIIDKNRPATYLMKRSLVLLPDKPARPRINDPRIGIFNTQRTVFKPDESGTEKVNYAHRWNLQPKDTAAFKAGKLVEPVNPITFYIDDHFPDKWLKYIKAGTKDWNEAFREIGYKHAVVTKMYPEDDSTFDPDNLKYNTIKYVSTPKKNSMGPSWVDPRSGEILSANVFVYHGITDLLNEWIFKQTAAADQRVRGTRVPDKIIGKALRYVVAHEVGHTLGLMHNMGASSAFPTDSLRSPSFTQKYGTTPSIMDYARFNSVAQPGDRKRGVKLHPPRLGVYDKYAIKWLYSPLFNADTPEDEVPELDHWITQKTKAPMYRYGKQQLRVIDPSAQTEDLGGDLIKTASYYFKNLKFIMNHLNEWVKDEDQDLSFRTTQYFGIINIYFFWPLQHTMFNIGGIYQNEVYASDHRPAYRVVPEEIQHQSTMFYLRTLGNLDWFNNATLNKNINDIHDKPAEYMQRALITYLLKVCPPRVALSESKATGETYTRKKLLSDIFNYIWGPAMEEKESSKAKQVMQKTFTNFAIARSHVKKVPKSDPFSLAGDTDRGYQNLNTKDYSSLVQTQMLDGLSFRSHTAGIRDVLGGPDEVSGFGIFGGVPHVNANMDHLYYRYLMKTKNILQEAVKTATGEQKTRYQYMLIKVKRALNAH